MASYLVEGMTCMGCARSVTNAIETAAPGATVAVNLEAKTVDVGGDAAAAVVQQAVEDAGFEFKGAA